MIFSGTPLVDDRDAGAILALLETLRPAFVPGLQSAPGGPSRALFEIVARFSQIAIDRLNQAPDKNLLAFLDMLSVSLVPAQAARAPVVFQPMPVAADGHVPARTRAGAKSPDNPAPVVFETERDIAMTAAKLMEVFTVVPSEDAYADHSAQLASRTKFTLFTPLQPVPRHLYVAHDTLLDFAAKSTIEVELDLGVLGSRALRSVWEYWDGQVWRPSSPFDSGNANASHDGTAGFTRSGVVSLRAECGKSAKTKVNGFDAFWMRARLDEPLPPDPSQTLATIERVRLRTAIDRPLTHSGKNCTGGLIPEQAFADAGSVDLSKIFYPMGKTPQTDVSFYFACDEPFSKSGAKVSVCFTRVKTPEEQADELGTKFDIDVNAARIKLQKLAQPAARIAVDAANSLIATVMTVVTNPAAAQATIAAFDGTIPGIDVDTIDTAAAGAQGVAAAIAGLVNAPDPLEGEISFNIRMNAAAASLEAAADRVVDVLKGVRDFGPAEGAAVGGIDINEVVTLLVDVATRAVAVVGELVEEARSLALFGVIPNVDAEWNNLKTAGASLDLNKLDPLPDLADKVAAALKAVPYGVFIIFPPNIGNLVTDAANRARNVVNQSKAMLDSLAKFKPTPGPSPPPPALAPARLVWEYFNGNRWKILLGESADPVRNLLASGEISFAVPLDLAKAKVNGTTARWIRARLSSGSYGRLRQMTWYDSQAKRINMFPLIEGRPPALVNLFVGYTYRSRWEFPERCLTYNDFLYEDHSRDVRWPGGLFPPYQPMPDSVPSLYLSFDRPLPNDFVSTYVDVEETLDDRPALVWEAWDGDWRELRVSDETGSLARQGMVAFIPPSVAARPEIPISGSAMALTAGSAQDANRFRAGDRVVILQGGVQQEMALVANISGTTLELTAPVGGTYNNATLTRAALPRLGISRDWVRARLKQPGAAPKAVVDGIWLNATWAAQAQTVTDETLGAGNGQPGQAMFFKQVPVLPSERVEVRELDGARADVELPILREELLAAGFTDDDIRTVTDSRTRRITEVWVRWRSRPHLYYSGPGDRHYQVERARGRLQFGGDGRGLMPPVGNSNVRASLYVAGGGAAGNVAAGAINQLLSGAPAISVVNPRAAQGGADSELTVRLRHRGPQVPRHRGRSISALDYEALALEASPGVASVRVLPATSANGRPDPGSVRVLIVPRSLDRQPWPSFELRRQVHDYLAARAPATVASFQIAVSGPQYLPVGLRAVVLARDPAESGTVEQRVLVAVETFLHPVTGGPEGLGWAFGRDVFMSDVAAILEAVPGVDFASQLDLLVDDTPVGDRVAVPIDRIVVAGPLRIEMQFPEI